MRRLALWVPLAVFALLVGLVAIGLIKPRDRDVRSAMIDRPLPDFTLAPIVPTKPGIASTSFGGGRPRLLNIFASWCVPCIAEAPQLMRLKAMGVPIDAIAIRDTSDQVRTFLARHGDPYDRIGSDPRSVAQIALGSSGVPESFVIDGRGRIVRQFIGDIRAEDVAAIAAAVRNAR
ncbi:redoxin family protein [uncultured Sphingomonas sp.]|uniref:redoxin family protein n=1 Tax=uncultured Sphingomonas sp. TaxID=158754 RepID=UPI0035CA2781